MEEEAHVTTDRESETARPGAESILDGIQTPETQEETPVTDPEEAGQEMERVMTNPIIMENIADFLSDKDLVALCLASKNTKKIVDQMDSICWRKRAKKLQAVLSLDATDSDSTTFKEMYLLLKPKVEMLTNKIRGKIEKNSGHIAVVDRLVMDDSDPDEDEDVQFMSPQELANTASLVHHDMLGEVSIKSLVLLDEDLSSIPDLQLGSLASYVTDTVGISVGIGIDSIMPDLSVLLDNVKSDDIEIDNSSQDGQILGSDTILALVRAMQTRVKRVTFLSGAADVKALLRTYDGKGKCEEIRLVVSDSIESRQCSDDLRLRHLAQIIDWDVDITLDPYETDFVNIILTRGQQG